MVSGADRLLRARSRLAAHERSIIPFRVDDAQAVAVQNLPFAMVPS